MTRQDKDRRAFEAEYIKRYEPELPPSFVMGSYMEPCQNVAWHFWQAARKHYAPKLTEKEAIELLLDTPYPVGKSGTVISMQKSQAGFLITALRAGGMQFKEEG